ncbi:hypothetical protein N9D66_01925 [Candidatus Nanopelagicales bacterium]|nr:hypothetical protein [Candidatus Nanopelagicales bacterium]
MKKLVSAATVIGISAGLALAGAPASASHHLDPLSKKEMKRAGLKVSDIPASYGTDLKRDFTYSKGKKAAKPDLCLKGNGDPREGKKPWRSSTNLVGLAEDLDNFTFTETNSNLYQYRNSKKALHAFRDLRKQAKKCVGTEKAKFDADGVKGEIDISAKKKKAARIGDVNGFGLELDLSLSIDVADVVDLSLIADQYAIYHLSGATIVRVEYADVSGEDLNAVTKTVKRYVKDTARTVTYRTWTAATT